MHDLEALSAFTRPGILRAVIEIPAGSVEKRQYDKARGAFPIDARDGRPRIIRFLPYPANYGFIPGTRMRKEEGGDGDAVDVLVLCGALPSGTVIEVEAIGVIELVDAGERDDKLIAVPLDPALRNIDAHDMNELPAAVMQIIQAWLLNYDPVDQAALVGVKGREEALAVVRRWLNEGA